MQVKVYKDDGNISIYDIDKNSYKKSDEVIPICKDTKEENLLAMIEAFYSDSRAIIYDRANKQISNCVDTLMSNEIKKEDFNFMFFTSGTTGESLGALKTKENLVSEIAVTSKMLEKYNINKVIVTVPFVHIYGMLFGLVYPLQNDIDIVLKEHFLPHDLLELIDENSLVVTTPLYIKALNQLSEYKNLSKSIFVSSTAPLEARDAISFKNKFGCNIIQVYGSTESGGIATKINDEEFWQPMQNVQIDTNEDKELKITSPYLSQRLYEKGFKDIQNGWLQTFDFVEIKDEKFKLVGRSSKILKVAGKRYSTVEIENILEECKYIDKALAFVSRDKDALKDEVLELFIESDKEISVKDVKDALKKRLSNLKFKIKLHNVGKIELSSVGKKMKPNRS